MDIHGFRRPTEVRPPVLGLDARICSMGIHGNDWVLKKEEDWSCRLSGSSDGKVKYGRPDLHTLLLQGNGQQVRDKALCKLVQQAAFEGLFPFRPGACSNVPSAVYVCLNEDRRKLGTNYDSSHDVCLHVLGLDTSFE